MLPVDDPPSAALDIYRDRFERCFRDHYAQVLAFSLRRLSGRELAEDVVADTFAVAWRRRDRIPDPALPWLYAIAANVIANQYRSNRRRHDLDRRTRVAPSRREATPPNRSIGATPSRPPSPSSPSQSARCCAWSPGTDSTAATRRGSSAARRGLSGCGCTAPAASSRNNSRQPDI